MSESVPSQNLLWIRRASQRASVGAHLRHIAGTFRGAGWSVVDGETPPSTPHGALAVLDDLWLEPLPQVAAHLADPARTSGSAGKWQLPLVLGLEGAQGWHPRHPPQTLRGYERVALRPARTRAASAAPVTPLWPGFAVAPSRAVQSLLEAEWPPPQDRMELVPSARLFRYTDPAGHPRTELDPFIPDSARLLVDVGCGHGLLGERHRRSGRLVVGIEPDWPLAREAARRLNTVLPVRAEEGLAALGNRADCIVLADVLEHTEDPAAVLRQVAAALTDDGRAILALPNSAHAPVLRALAAGRWDTTLAGVQARDHLAPMTPDSFARLARECGLQVEHTELLTTPLPLSLRLWAWWAARTTGGDPKVLHAPQWIAVLRKARSASNPVE